MLILLTALTIKHFVFDFLYQPPYQWKNKGTYGHWGGLVHSGQHMVATFIILLFFTNPLIALGVSFLEFVIHYHMDYLKMVTNRVKGWTATTHNEFWILVGFDQLVHSMTYILIVFLVFGSVS